MARFIREASYIPFMVRRGLVSGRCGTVVAYSPPLSLGVAAVILGVLWGVPTILWLQDSFSNIIEATGAVRNPVLLALVRLFERVLYRLVGRIALAGVDLKHVLRFVGPKKVTVIANWSTVSTNGDRSLATGEFIALFGGVIGYAQDVSILADVAERLRYDSRIRFIIAGDGPQRKYLAEILHARNLQNVTLLPFLPPAAYERFVVQAGCGLVTLRPGVVSIPSKITAFLSAGIPVVAALPSGGTAAQLVRDSGGGIQVSAGDSDGMARAIVGLASYPEVCQRLSANGKAFARTMLSAEKAFEAWDDLLRSL